MGSNNILSRNEFIKVMNKFRDIFDAEDKINMLLNDCESSGSIDISKTIPDTIHILEVMFRDADKMIEFFCCELDFGRKWVPMMITDAENNDIPMRDAEDLYNFLVSGK